TDHGPDRHTITRLRRVRRNVKHTAVEALDLLDRLVAFEAEHRVARPDGIAVGLQPLDERAFLHVPAESGDRDGNRHDPHSASNSRMARTTASVSGTTAASSGGLYGVGVWRPFSRRM